MKRFFMGGLSALLPTILTLWVVVALVGFIGDYVASPMTRLVHWSLVTNRIGQDILESTTPIQVFDERFVDPKALDDGETAATAIAASKRASGFLLDLSKLDQPKLYAALADRIPPSFGLAIGFVLIFLAGCLFRGVAGRWLFGRAERLLFSFPLVKSIYPWAKQIVEFFCKDKQTVREFQTVVAVPYPRPGMFTLGFVTNDGLQSLNAQTDGEYIAVFLPSSPTPMTGYICFVDKREIVPLALSFDQVMGLLVSGGVIVPDEEVVRLAAGRRGSPRGGLNAVDAAPGLVRNATNARTAAQAEPDEPSAADRAQANSNDPACPDRPTAPITS
ncbi:MAG: DUF502 domain-containing protein [Planctomycetes bacterium]|nr:DUF502 domain-containing protein [Planctomycetota bacterium]MCB9891308.1 DUF502 domain-containing protein [Planctomycetota bacterium]MCB9919433.1 DUF502 domain-containing protein [Planctomycetota bacterium]